MSYNLIDHRTPPPKAYANMKKKINTVNYR